MLSFKPTFSLSSLTFIRRLWFDSWVGQVSWRRDRLFTPVFLGFPGGSAGKESACNAGDLGSILGLGKILWRRERLPTPVLWPGEFHRVAKNQTRLSNFHFHLSQRNQNYQLLQGREKAREFQKDIYFCFIYYTKSFDCVDHNKLWKILQEMGIPDHLTCLLKNLYAGQ